MLNGNVHHTAPWSTVALLAQRPVVLPWLATPHEPWFLRLSAMDKESTCEHHPDPSHPHLAQIITGKILADGGEVIKARADLRVAMLSQEFGVQLGRTLREEFLSAFEEAVQVGE